MENTITDRTVYKQNKKQQIGNYIISKKLNTNKNNIYKVKHRKTGKDFIMKEYMINEIKGDPKRNKFLHAEITIMNKINHDNIVHLHDFLASSQRYYLIMDYCNQRDIRTYMKSEGVDMFEEEEAVGFLRQIANGFVELKKHKVFHRNFKLSSILLSDGVVKISDFGYSKINADVTTTKMTNNTHLAPELLNSTTKSYNSKVDIWSIGVAYYQMLFKKRPFEKISTRALKREIRSKSGKKLPFPKDIQISSESKDLLQKIFIEDPEKRISWTDFFNHPLFEKFNLKSDFDQDDDPDAYNEFILSKKIREEFKRNAGEVGKLKDDFYDDELHVDELMVPASASNEGGGFFDFLSGSDKNEKKIKAKADHEQSKLIFLGNAVERISGFAGSQKMSAELNSALVNLSLLLSKKIEVASVYLIQKIKKGINVIEMTDSEFNTFISSNMSNHFLVYCETFMINNQAHFKNLYGNAVDDGVDIRGMDLKIGGTNLENLNKSIIKIVNEILSNSEFKKLKVDLSVLRRTRKYIEYAGAYDKVFSFNVGNSSDSHFDWSKLYEELNRD